MSDDWMFEHDVEMTVVSVEFAKRGYSPEATLAIQPSMGRYVVTLRLNTSKGEEREVAWEPSEPERQDLAIRYAHSNPEGAVIEAIEIDLRRREEEAGA